MNYDSIEEILAAGITNMTVLRNNVKQDDGTDILTGVNWFTFNDTVASTIYASGNSWLGFGSSSEHLKVNRIDGALYSLYREEGTLYNHYKFLKIRWKGYSHYNYTTSAYAVEYDVILWDTGDISLHMISIPTSYNTGTYSLVANTTYNYSVSTDNPDVTFTKTDSGFAVSNTLISLSIPFEERYLFRLGSTLYTVTDGVLSGLSDTSLTANTFLTHGIQTLTPDILALVNGKEILYWRETTDFGIPTGIAIYGVPPLPQEIAVFIPNTSIKSIAKLEAICSDDAVFAISTDGGNTKMYYDTANNTWNTINSNFSEVGMSLSVLCGIDATGWSQFTGSASVMVCALLPTIDSYFSKLAVKYTN